MRSFSLATLLFCLWGSTLQAEEVGTVVALQGATVLELSDGRTVALAGVDVTGLDAKQHERLVKWLEVYVLDRQVSFHYVKRTGMGRVMAVPVWRKHDIVGTLLQQGLVKLDPPNVPPARLAVWREYSLAAKTKRLGIWAVSVPARAVVRVLPPPEPVLIATPQ